MKTFSIHNFFLINIIIFCSLFFMNGVLVEASIDKNQNANTQTAPLPTTNTEGNSLYTGRIYHIFFHSLIVYPKLAFSDSKFSAGYQDWMITRDEFQKILPELYKNNYIIIDINSLYGVNKDGTVFKKSIYLPKDKKPLIISLDDLAYYPSLKGHGFADKLVFDKNGNVATEIITPEGKKEITRDGDVVPILDDFITTHPDFSWKGAKGIIAVTGYEGILGYRTNKINSSNYKTDVKSVKKIISKLKETGWRFASHSFSHDKEFVTGNISLDKVKADTILWDKEVRPLVGDTDIFIGPFGQIFNSTNDARRAYLISDGFKMFCGVWMNQYFDFFSDSISMDRADIDGYRLNHTPYLLKEYFDPNDVIDPLRKKYTNYQN